MIRAALVAVMTVPAAVSCFDPSGLQEQIDMLIDELKSLEERLNTEIGALNQMLKGTVHITNISRDAATGITTVTLSDGKTLQLLPEKDMKSFITYVTLGDGVDYWAYINSEGKKELFLNEDGEPVPVMSEMPKVENIDGESYLVVGGVRYPLSGNSVFSDYELVVDELTGEIYAVTFTFGDDMTFTVTVDGACGFYFVTPSGGFGQSTIIDNYYVPYGTTERVQIDARGVVDYVLQIPDGWRVKEYTDIYMGTRYLDITAPKKELVENGYAAGDDNLKVVAVLEGGKATVSTLYLTTKPFETMSVSYGKATLMKYNGLQKFVYGVCLASEYDETEIFSTASGLLSAYDYPAGYDITTGNIVSKDMSAVAGQNLVPGEKYTLWAIPALYFTTADDAGYYLAEGTVEALDFVYSTVTFEITEETFRDAQLSMTLAGIAEYYTGLVKAEDFLMLDVVYGLNNPGYYTAKTSPMTFEGSVFEFAGVTAEQATDYVAWLAVKEDGKTYTESDVVVVEFGTLNLTEGSNVKVLHSDDNLQAVEFRTTLSAPGAEAVYYSFLTESESKKYTTTATKANYLFEKGIKFTTESKEVAATEVIAKVKPKTKYVLLAVAVDSEGHYGEALTLDFTTTELQYNDLTIEFEMISNDPNNVVLGISSEGAQEYIYWLGLVSENLWKSPNYLGGNAENAQEYLYVNTTNAVIQKVMTKYPIVDGKITMTDLSMSKDYVIVAMAKGAEGLYSHAFAYFFVPRPVAIGTVVNSTDPKWESARPTVTFTPEVFVPAAGQMPGTFGFDVTIPAGFTAYVLAGTDSYLNEGNADLVLTTEEKIVKIIQNVDKPRSNNVTVDYDLWGEKGYPYGYEFYHYEHGNPLFGNVVIWANREFHDAHCDCGGNFIKQIKVTNVTEGQVTVDEKWCININDGKPLAVRQPYAMGSTTEVIDRVFVVCMDLDGNCYAPFEYDVDPELFANATARDE